MTEQIGRSPASQGRATGLRPQPATQSSQSSVPNAELLSLVGDLTHALYVTLACGRCWGNGFIITTMNERDECPVCRGEKSAFPEGFERVKVVAERCEAIASGMSAFGQDPKGLEAKPASPVGDSRDAHE